MNIGLLFFALGGAYAIYVVLRYNVVYARAVNELESTFKSEGREWNYQRDLGSRLSVFNPPESIADSGDSPAVILGKEKVLQIRRSMPAAIKRGILALVVAVVAATVAGLFGIEAVKKP
jgi:hypothetical protein